MKRLPPCTLRRRLQRFAAEDRASLSIEAAIMLPVLVALYVAGYQYFDQYRREAHMTKASYAVADMLSRRLSILTPHDLDGLESVYEALTYSEGASYMRFSEIRRTPGGLSVVWSYATDGQPLLNDQRLERVLNQIPRLDVNERITVVEAYTYDSPFFDVGLGDRIIPSFVPISQRYASCLPFTPETSQDPIGCVITGNGELVAVDPDTGRPFDGST